MKSLSLSLCLCLIFSCTAAHAQRVALVIGNAAYQNEKPLNNPINDAELIADVLRKDLQFDDVKLSKNLSRRDLNRQIAEFAQKAKGADAAFIYYSGHGMQRGGQNYLIPVDASIRDEADIDSEGVASAKLLAELENAAPKITVVVLDACRDNPYSTRSKSTSKGLARMGDVGEGMLVAYATRDGMTADDGSGRNSPYASALAQQLRNKQQPIRMAFEQVAEEVKAATSNKQKPVTYGDLRSSARLLPFFSNGKPVQSEAERQSIEDEAWSTAKQANTIEALDGYLEQYPSGRYAKLAQVKLKALRSRSGAVTTATSTANFGSDSPQTVGETSRSYVVNVADVKLDNKIRVGDAELFLNGATLYSKFGIAKVYVAGLYTTTKTADADAVILSGQPRRVLLVMKRDVDAAKMLEMFLYVLSANATVAERETLKPQLAQLNGIFMAVNEFKENDRIALDFGADGSMKITINGQAKGAIGGPDIGPAMLKIWLGKNPLQDLVKKGMLGTM